MSKTMDNDHKVQGWTIYDAVAEIERLKAELTSVTEAFRDHLHDKNVRISNLGYELETARTEAKEANDTLRARVEALVTDLRESDLAYHKLAGKGLALEKERDELRIQNDWLRISHSGLFSENEDLRTQLAAANEKLAALQPPAPTIVKQTWQSVCRDTTQPTIEWQDKADCYDFDDVIGHIRRDHMSDGTVVVTLETIGDEK